MSVSDIDLTKVFRVVALGGIVWALAVIATWAAGVEIIQACKVGAGVAVGWIAGNLPETGMIVPTLEGLRK